MTKLYIAYGSNMDEGQMAYRCPNAGVIGTGMVEGYRLLFKGGKNHAYATIEPEEDGKVPVLVWEISGADERRLDRYEGFPRFYYKKEIMVWVNGRQKNAMVYIMNEHNPLNRPSCEYYQILASVYRKYGFDAPVLARAMMESCPKENPVSITAKELKKLREEFKAGCRVELVRMEDCQAPPVGTKGTVILVDCIGNILINWDNGCGLNVVYGIDECCRLCGKEEIDCLFEKMVGIRFCGFRKMENWFRQKLKDTLPELIIKPCEGVNAEIREEQTEVDYSTDCTFGADIFGFEYADFTIDYILDNQKRMYVTYVQWN